MIKPDKNFRLSKSFKTLHAMCRGSNSDRSHFLGMLVQAQMSAESARRAALKGKGKTQD